MRTLPMADDGGSKVQKKRSGDASGGSAIDSGSQAALCPLPIRLDTYAGGCTHACSYCFIKRKPAGKVRPVPVEGADAVRRFAAGERTAKTSWADWNIPLHWGGMNDPFQPSERSYGTSYRTMQAFAETGHPVVISTKGAIVAEDKYLSLLKQMNVLFQLSIVSPELCEDEPGAPGFEERLKIMEKIGPHVPRMVVRVQPYIPSEHDSILETFKRYAEVGVHGVTLESMKSVKAQRGLVKVGGDFVYPLSVLRRRFEEARDAAHEAGLKFYAAENRLRSMGDSLACCGAEELEGFTPNKAELGHHFAGEEMVFTEAMKERGSGRVFATMAQTTISSRMLAELSYEDIMKRLPRSRTYREALGVRET